MRTRVGAWALLGVVLLTATGCPSDTDPTNPLGVNLFGLSVSPPQVCGSAIREAPAGGVVEVCLDIETSADFWGHVRVDLTAPADVDASFDPDESNPHEAVLLPGASRSFRLHVWVRVARGVSPGTYTVTVDADCCEGADDATASFTITVLDVPLPTDLIVFESHGSIYVINPDHTGLAQITPNSSGAEDPSWSPDRTRIAFVAFEPYPFSLEVYTMAADGTNPVRLTTLPGSDRRPAYSPDGTRIAFDNDGDGDDEIFVMNVDGTGVTQLTANAVDFDQGPSWSPGSTEIVFTSFRDGNDNLYVMNADGTGQTLLVDTGEHDWQPDWSPDGTRIVFSRQSLAGGPDDIFVVNADGVTGLQQLTFDAATDEEPTWSPDGNWIAFTSNRGGGRDLYIMRADGQLVMQLTYDHPMDAASPSWH